MTVFFASLFLKSAYHFARSVVCLSKKKIDAEAVHLSQHDPTLPGPCKYNQQAFFTAAYIGSRTRLARVSAVLGIFLELP